MKCQSLIQSWKWNALGAIQRASSSYSSNSANLADEHELLSRTAQQYEETATKHLELAYAQWTAADDRQRQAQWQLELARAFVKEQEKRKEVEGRLERVQQEASQLQAQVEMLSRCQWPREMALWPPERVPIGKETVQELRYGSGVQKSSTEEGQGRWDFDRLVGKWKKIIREDKSRMLGVLAAQMKGPLPDLDKASAPSTPQIPQPDMPVGLQKGMMNGNSGTEPRRRSGRTQLVTNMADQDDAAREFNEALKQRNGNG